MLPIPCALHPTLGTATYLEYSIYLNGPNSFMYFFRSRSLWASFTQNDSALFKSAGNTSELPPLPPLNLSYSLRILAVVCCNNFHLLNRLALILLASVSCSSCIKAPTKLLIDPSFASSWVSQHTLGTCFRCIFLVSGIWIPFLTSLDTGHSSSGCLRNSGLDCQRLFKSNSFLLQPLVAI